jgi:hypothetical protein
MLMRGMQTRWRICAWLSAVLAAIGVCVMLGFGTQIERVAYLWFEIPRVREELEKLPGITVIEVRDRGPSDEIYVWVVIHIEGKGKLVITSPRSNQVRDDQPVAINGIRGCTFIGSTVSNINPLPLSEAVQRYDKIYAEALAEGLCSK